MLAIRLLSLMCPIRMKVAMMSVDIAKDVDIFGNILGRVFLLRLLHILFLEVASGVRSLLIVCVLDSLFLLLPCLYVSWFGLMVC